MPQRGIFREAAILTTTRSITKFTVSTNSTVLTQPVDGSVGAKL